MTFTIGIDGDVELIDSTEFASIQVSITAYNSCNHQGQGVIDHTESFKINHPEEKLDSRMQPDTSRVETSGEPIIKHQRAAIKIH